MVSHPEGLNLFTSFGRGIFMSKLEMITNYFSVSLLCGVGFLFMCLFTNFSAAWILYPIGAFMGFCCALFCIHGSKKKDTWEPDPFIFFGTMRMFFITLVLTSFFLVSCIYKKELIVCLVIVIHLLFASTFFVLGLVKKSIKT